MQQILEDKNVRRLRLMALPFPEKVRAAAQQMQAVAKSKTEQNSR